MSSEITVSIILPCLNEEQAIVSCLKEIQATIKNAALSAEVIVANNNSTDASAALISEYRQHFPELSLVNETKEGYGFAYLKGINAAGGRYIFMADSDGTYDFSDIPRFLEELQNGSDMVVGNRFSEKISSASMPWLHHYLGNPFLSYLVRLFFNVKITDIHCGARAISRSALARLNLCTGGMEFASEMIIKAAKKHLKITEIPIKYRERLGESKLRSWADGWRHLRFIFLYSPVIIFMIPGLILFAAGTALALALYSNRLEFFGTPLYSYPIFLFSIMIIIGYQLILFGGFSKIYAVTHLGDDSRLVQKLFRHITIVKTGLIGLTGVIVGAAVFFVIFRNWIVSGFNPITEIKDFVAAFTVLILGIQTFFSAFIFSILGIKRK